MADFLTDALKKAIARGALAKHLEVCEVCSDDHDCVIAKLHKQVISPAAGADQ